MVEKLSKALEGLKNIQFSISVEDSALRKKEKMLTCAFVADMMVSLRFTNAQNLPQLVGIVIETLINLCNDKDSDVRMVADESLNRIIRALSESNMLKVQVELHKEIKKNGPARCLRAALWRFGQLSPYIRPNKGRGHVGNLIPYIVEICKREEESVHETLAVFNENTLKVIGVFMQDNDVKTLLRAFFHNLSSTNAVIRRTSASSINSIVKHCRKTHVFNSYMLNLLLDCLVPVNEENSSFLVLGVFACLRALLPNLGCDRNEEGISGSFGLRQKKDESLLSVDRLIQAYELCLHYSKSKDHNVVTASLETLNLLLQNPPLELSSFLLSPSGFGRSFIHYARENKLGSRSGSELSIACSIMGDETLLLDESDSVSFDLSTSFVPSDADPKNPKPSCSFELFDEEIKMVDNPFKDKLLGEIFDDQINTSTDSDTASLAQSEMNASSLLMRFDTEASETSTFKEYSRAESRDDMYSNVEEEVIHNEMIVDVGAFTDSEVPLIYCARHLAASFLLGGTKNSLKADQTIRVSVKSLALNCISAIVKLYPPILRMNLAKNNAEVHNQELKDILLLADHSDPQIRGNLSILIASFINSVLLDSKGFESEWFTNENDFLNIHNLLDLLLKGLKDESTTCSRQVLSGLKFVLTTLLYSAKPAKVLSIIDYIPSLVNSSYWLLKVKLVELVTELPFICLNELTSSNYYQNEILDTVLFPLLGDEDIRVRTAAAEAITKIIPHLYYGNSTLLAYSKEFTFQIKNCLKSKKDVPVSGIYSRPFPPLCYIAQYDTNSDFDPTSEGSLSRIISKLTESLMISVDKSYIFGCLEALKSLSEKYPPPVYVNAWNCLKYNNGCKEESELTSSLLANILNLLVMSPIISDLGALTNATTILGNLFAGHCICNIKSNYQVSLPSTAWVPVKYWAALKDEKLSVLAEHIFTHVMKVLNIYSHLLEEIPLSKAVASTSATTNLLPLSFASPIKRQEKTLDKEDKFEDRKQKNINYLKQSTHYSKLYQLLKSTHNNYKVSLDSSVGETFLSLLESTLKVLSILLEIGTVRDTGRCAEEILSYLRGTISLRASASVQCGLQLLKSLFGTNLAVNWEEKNTGECENLGQSLYANIFQSPSEFFFNTISCHSIASTLEYENLTGCRRRTDKKIQNTDKNCLATYIRLFEPMLIKSLQLYTITNDVNLQSNVLQLLNHLIQLRVNYCLLDADEIFVTFVLKQFELIEHGQIPGIEKLLPEIFKFLILLSYEKLHSKTIISVPKILQLCDVLMASNQSTRTHCIPALVPIVDDIFLSRNIISAAAQEKELETQREVVFAMLLRLVEFPEVMNMMSSILNESRTLEERETWKRWSRQVMDAVLPLASQDKLRIDTFEGQESFNKLMSSLSPNVLRPIDPLLKILFVEPNDYDCSLSLKRWISRVTVIMETIFHVKEDVLLCRLEEISPNINLSTFLPPKKMQSFDPFNIQSAFQKYEPSEAFARFLMKVISVTASKILESISTSSHYQRQLSIFFLCIFHIMKSGTFHRICNSLQLLLVTEKDLVSTICTMFINFMNFAPVLSCQFSYFLAIFNYFDKSYWTRILSEKSTLSSKLVQYCGVISLCDYLCEILSDSDTLSFLLSKNIKEVILLSNEAPTKELLTTVLRRPESILLLRAIGSETIDANNPQYVEKLLRVLEIANNSHSGFILFLLIKKFIKSPYLTVSRLAGLLASRRAEFILALPAEEVPYQLSKDQFFDIIKFMNNKKLIKRHYALIGLLNKLCTEVYKIPPIELIQTRVLNPQQIKAIKLDEDWHLKQIKERCCQESYSGREIADLLNKLTYDDILKIMSSPNFNVEILKHCLLLLKFERRREIYLDSSNCMDPLPFDSVRGRTNFLEFCAFDDNVKNYKSAKRIRKAAVNSHGSDTEEELLSHSNLHKASKFFILESISCLVQKPEVTKGVEEASEVEYRLRLSKVIEDETLYFRIWQFAPAVSILVDLILCEETDIEDEHHEPLMEFGLILLEILNFLCQKEINGEKLTNRSVNREILENGLSCCTNILRSSQVSDLLSKSSKRMRLKSSIQNLFGIVNYLIPQSGKRMCYLLGRNELFDKAYEYDELRLMDMLLMLHIKGSLKSLMPSYLRNIIGDLIICMCEIPEISIRVLKVPDNCDIQEIEPLETFISTFSKVKWTSRQQFEEIWVGLLAVLGFTSENNISVEENTLAVQASTAAVEGITTLLKNTMINPITKKILHHGRDTTKLKNFIDDVPFVADIEPNNKFGDRLFHFSDNLEIPKLTDRYYHGLLSVEYICSAMNLIYTKIDLHVSHTDYIDSIGLDLTSCIQLLMDLYNQWMFQPSPDIRLITSCLKSAIVISDLFTDSAQYQWLLDFCLRIEHIVISENVVILPLIIIGCCKAVPIVLPDLEMCQKIKRLMLSSHHIPCQIAVLQGLLHLLQSPVVEVATTESQTRRNALYAGGVDLVQNISDTFLPIAIDAIQNFKHEGLLINEEYDRYLWTLVFFLMEYYPSEMGELREEMHNSILVELRRRGRSNTVMSILIRGVERLLLTTVTDEFFKDQLCKISLEIISQDSVTLSLYGLQLLMILSFLERKQKDVKLLVKDLEDTEKIMKDMEKINALFEKLKRSYTEEAEFIGHVLSYILNDITASDVLTKVIQEFLSPNQPHLKILSGLLFNVFERADVTLLVDWIVFSLPSFIQGLPVGMSVWTLNCFFVSASSERWLRSLFPLVQSRIRLAEEEDVKLLCLAASNFYKQLIDEKQKTLFVTAFENAAQTHSIYRDLLASVIAK